jgi:hypothetical protein
MHPMKVILLLIMYTYVGGLPFEHYLILLLLRNEQIYE